MLYVQGDPKNNFPQKRKNLVLKPVNKAVFCRQIWV